MTLDASAGASIMTPITADASLPVISTAARSTAAGGRTSVSQTTKSWQCEALPAAAETFSVTGTRPRALLVARTNCMSNPPLPPLPTSGFGHLAIPQGVPEPSTTDGVPAALAVGSGVAPLPAVPEVIRSGAELVTGDGRSLPLVSARLHGTAHGGVARLVLEQRFENPHDETLHVTYRMPLPADGAVSGYTFVVADRTIAGRVERTPDARERFERAIAAGHTAALLEQERADVFTQSIANLPANEALIAQITVDVRLAWLPEGEWELRFPTVIGPRYASSQASAADARAARVTTTPDGVPARIHIAIDILDAVTAGCTPSSPSHALAFGDRGRIELRDAVGARLDRDIVVRWPVAGPSIGVSLAVVRPGRDTDCYGLVTIVPPAPTARPGTVRRDLVLVVDISGSMAGAPLDKAKQVLGLVIESLGDDDRFNLIAFSSTLCRYQLAPVPATPGEKQSALRWLRALSARGGTEMEQAVKEVLNMLDPLARAQIVIATDGYVAGDTAILDRLHAQRTGPRLHFLGIGSSVNRGLASAMARAGRGAAVTCDLDEDAERAAKRLIDHTRSPVITDVSLHGAVIAHAPDRLPDVYAAAPVIAAVRLGPGTLVVRGRIGGGDWERRISVR
ncbi:MAG: VWA domain-containing protein, partial [Deltaproteobacteria bacterium]